MWEQMCLRQDVHRAEPSWGQLMVWASKAACWRWPGLPTAAAGARLGPRLAWKVLCCPITHPHSVLNSGQMPPLPGNSFFCSIIRSHNFFSSPFFFLLTCPLLLLLNFPNLLQALGSLTWKMSCLQPDLLDINGRCFKRVFTLPPVESAAPGRGPLWK